MEFFDAFLKFLAEINQYIYWQVTLIYIAAGYLSRLFLPNIKMDTKTVGLGSILSVIYMAALWHDGEIMLSKMVTSLAFAILTYRLALKWITDKLINNKLISVNGGALDDNCQCTGDYYPAIEVATFDPNFDDYGDLLVFHNEDLHVKNAFGQYHSTFIGTRPPNKPVRV